MRNSFLFFASVVALSVALSVAGCSQGSNYEGKWIASEKSAWDGTKFIRKLEIKRNDGNFLLYRSVEGYRDTGRTLGEAGKHAAWRQKPLDTISATLKEGKLMVDGGFSYTYVKDDETILGPGGEIYNKETLDQFKKLKNEAAESYKKKTLKRFSISRRDKWGRGGTGTRPPLLQAFLPEGNQWAGLQRCGRGRCRNRS